MGKLAVLFEKRGDVRKARDRWEMSIIEFDEEMFENVSKNKTKDTLIAESATDATGYEDKADDSVLANDEAVKKAESLLADVVTPQVQSGGTQEGDPQWSAFKP